MLFCLGPRLYDAQLGMFELHDCKVHFHRYRLQAIAVGLKKAFGPQQNVVSIKYMGMGKILVSIGINVANMLIVDAWAEVTEESEHEPAEDKRRHRGELRRQTAELKNEIHSDGDLNRLCSVFPSFITTLNISRFKSGAKMPKVPNNMRLDAAWMNEAVNADAIADAASSPSS